MKYAIDRIEEEIAVLENLETLEMSEVSTSELPGDIKEGSILVFVDNEYKLDISEEVKRRKRIEEKFNRLKRKN